MARRTSTSTSTSTDEAATPEIITEENTVTETAVEPAVEADTTEAAVEPAEAVVPVDLTNFLAAVETAIESRDTSTGDVPTMHIEPVQAAYRDLGVLKAKNTAKGVLADGMKSSMNALDITSARAYMVLTESLTNTTAAAKVKVERVPADPRGAFIERYNAFQLAFELVAADAPEGVDFTDLDVSDEMRDQARALLAHNASTDENKGDAPEVSSIVRNAIKLASGKATGAGRKASAGGASTSNGVRRDIASHIVSAFAGVGSGDFLTVAEIRTHQSDEYGTESPSAGALSARLFPASGKSTVDGITPGTNDKGVRGATKA